MRQWQLGSQMKPHWRLQFERRSQKPKRFRRSWTKLFVMDSVIKNNLSLGMANEKE